MSTPSDQLDNQTMAMKKDLEAMSEIVRDIAQEDLEHACATASESRAPVAEKVHGAACTCEQFISARPLRSVLMATGVGWLLGRFWKRRSP